MAPSTARANLLSAPQGDFVIGEHPIPEPAPGSILMKIEMCGVCGTDVHTWHASAEDVGCEYPISLGHEISGTIAALGDGVTADYIGQPLGVGDRIGICPAIHCHRCYYCMIAKTPEKCTDWKTYGTWPRADQEPHFTGGYGDYLYIHDPNSVALKNSTPPPERTAFLEPMAVVVHSMLHADIKLGDTVVVQGCGPIGLLTVACPKLAGASRIIATGRRNRKRLELANNMGADLTICQVDMPDEDQRRQFVFDNSLNLVGADVVINTVGTAPAFKECLGFVRNSGTLVEVGNFVDSGTFDFNPCRDLLE